MKLRTISILKYASYASTGMGTLGTGYLVYSKGDLLKSGFQIFDLHSTNTRLAIVWGLCALVTLYSPVLAKYFQGLQDRYRLNDQKFVELYKQKLANAINGLIDVRSNLADSDDVELELLRTVVGITKYYLGVGDEANINANMMIPLEADDPSCSEIRFLERPLTEARRRCQWLLRIDKWAQFEAEVPSEFCLPVYHPDGEWKNKVLLGAPRAFIERRPVIINNTLDLKRHWTTGVSESVKLELKQYFQKEKKVLRSFASLPAVIDANSDPVAIVNIHWNRKKIFGRSAGLVQDLLLPFLLVLAHMRIGRDEVILE